MSPTPQPPPAGLRVGFVPGVTLTKWRRIWGERFPRTPLEVVELAEADQLAALLDGRVDMCFARLPLDQEGLHRIPLYEETTVIWLSKDHLLSALDEITDDDLADDRVLAAHDPASVDLAVYGAAVLRVPLSIARTFSRRDMTHRPLVGAPTTTVALAWPISADDPRIDEFIGVVRGRTPNSSRTAAERRDRPRRRRRTP